MASGDIEIAVNLWYCTIMIKNQVVFMFIGRNLSV